LRFEFHTKSNSDCGIRFLSESEDIRWRHLYIREIGHEEAIKRLRGNESAIGFVPIFNGENLDAWKGALDEKPE